MSLEFGNGLADNVEQESEPNEIIKIIGVGGAGCNAVNNMFRMGIKGVNYIVCNTDVQSLLASPITRKIQLGKTLTEGLGAGNNPECGKNSALEASREIEEVLNNNTKMVFITAGMGGGTGTGAAPVVAQMAKERGILTIGIVTIPNRYEGTPRVRSAIKGVEEMSKYVDSLLIIKTEKLSEMYGDITLREKFAKADEVLAIAAKGLAEMISKHMELNVDFADVRTALTNSGCSVMGTGEGAGEHRAIEALRNALDCPLLNNSDINGSTYVLVNITANPEHEILEREAKLIMDTIHQLAGGEENERYQTIWGAGKDENIEGDKVRVTVIATGFAANGFELVPRKKEGNARISVNGTIIDESGERPNIVKFTDPEKEHYDNLIKEIYNNKSHSSVERYDVRDLADATSIPLDKLDDKTLSELETTPAYERRKNI